MGLRLGFHYHAPVYRDADGRLMAAGDQGRFIEGLAGACEKVVCFLHAPRESQLAYMNYELTPSNIEWVNIGTHTSVPRRMIQPGRYVDQVVARRHDLDALLLRGPSPLLGPMGRAHPDLPVVLLLVGDYQRGVSDLPQPFWRKELIRLWANYNKHQQISTARRTLTFVNSRELYDELKDTVPQLHETRTTTLTATDFYERDDTCQADRCRLLYTGRMDRTKGLFQMAEAVAALVGQGEDVVLDLVGRPQPGDTILDELDVFAREHGIADRIIFHGFKTVGPELFQYYKDADIYVLASLGSEGFPRTIWEALAHSLPVVATEVGSIPMFLQDGHDVTLVEPRSSTALVEAIKALRNDPARRQAQIANGRATVRQNTLENRSQELVGTITDWLNGKGGAA
jgi:glycosyltransferase involved in cell wall biosynthesis